MTVFQLFKVESFKRYSDFYIEQYLYFSSFTTLNYISRLSSGLFFDIKQYIS